MLPNDPSPSASLYLEDEIELVHAAAAGGSAAAEAFDLLTAHYRTPLYRYLYARTGSRRRAEALTTSVLGGLARPGARLPRGRFPGLFGAAVFNAARAALSSADDCPAPDIPVTDGDLERLAEALTRLSSGERELIRLRYAAGLPDELVARLFRRRKEQVSASYQGVHTRLESDLAGYPAEPSPVTERLLARLFTAAEPSQALQGELEAGSALARSAWEERLPPARRVASGAARGLRRQLWTTASLALIALVGAVAYVGPQQAARTAQTVLNRVPGLANLNLESTRILDAPVRVTRGDVTLTVEQVIAEVERTVVRLSASGLEGLAGSTAGPANRMVLRLPDGSELRASRMELYLGAGWLEFPALPPSARQASLYLERLPLVPPGEAPQGWLVELPLRKPAPAERPAYGYSPRQAAAENQGIRMEVARVAAQADETEVEVRLRWVHPDWRLLGHATGLLLVDQDGVRYPQLRREENGSNLVLIVEPPRWNSAVDGASTWQHTYRFAPLPEGSQQLSLVLNQISFSTPVYVAFAPVAAPEASLEDQMVWADGQGRVVAAASYPVSIAQQRLLFDELYRTGGTARLARTAAPSASLDVAGFPVQLTEASIEQRGTLDGRRRDRYAILRLTFDVQQQPGRTLDSFDLELPEFAVTGTARRNPSGSGEFTADIRLNYTPDQLPNLQIVKARLSVRGPWVVTWEND